MTFSQILFTDRGQREERNSALQYEFADDVFRVVVVAAAAHPIAWLQLHGRAVGVVALGAAREVVVAAHAAEPVALMPSL